MANVTPALEVEIREMSPQPFLGKRVHAALGAVGPEVEAGFASLYTKLSILGVAPSGPPFLIADVPRDGYLDMELGAPCARLVQPGDGFEAATLPGGRAAVAVHRGAYDAIGKVYSELGSWIAAQGLVAAGPPREVYLTGPGEKPVTELIWPVR